MQSFFYFILEIDILSRAGLSRAQDICGTPQKRVSNFVSHKLSYSGRLTRRIVTRTQLVTAFLVSRKCDYLETLQYTDLQQNIFYLTK